MGQRLPGKASVAPRADDHPEARENEGRDDEQDDEQSLLHVLSLVYKTREVVTVFPTS